MSSNPGGWGPGGGGTSRNPGGWQPAVQGTTENPGGWQPIAQGTTENLGGWQSGVQGTTGNLGGWQPIVQGTTGSLGDLQPGVQGTTGSLGDWQSGVQGTTGNLGGWQPIVQGTTGSLGDWPPGTQGTTGNLGDWPPGTQGTTGNLGDWPPGTQGTTGNLGGWQPGIGDMSEGISSNVEAQPTLAAIDGYPDDWHPETHRSPIGWQPGVEPGVEGMSGYPDDWYNVNGNIPCPARGCYMLFDSSNIHNLASHWSDTNNLASHWNDINNPALSKLTKIEHCILFHMLNQGSCPLCGVATAGGKYLYSHEKERHKSSLLSNLEGFIALVRNVSPLHGHQEWAHQAIFQRLGLSISLDVALRRDLERQASYATGYQPGTNFSSILSPPGNRPGGPTAPINTPIPADDFLKHLAPTAAYSEHGEPSWASTWQALRTRYALGKI